MITCICDFMIQVWMIAYVNGWYASIVMHDLKDTDMTYGKVCKYAKYGTKEMLCIAYG